MVNKRLFTVSLLALLVTGCGSKEEEEVPSGGEIPAQQEANDDLPPIEIDATLEEQLVGIWELIEVGGERVGTDHPMFGIRHAFVDDHTYLLSQNIGQDSTVGVGGGTWAFDPITQQITAFILPDSVTEILIMNEINRRQMQTETVGGLMQTWRRVENAP